MPENRIAESRANTLAHFSRANIMPERRAEHVSAELGFRVVQNVFRQTRADLNWIASELEISRADGAVVKTVLLDDSAFFHHWMRTNTGDYLVFAEVLCGGISVINLRTMQFHSYTDGSDGFIMTGFFLSPDQRKLAVPGCCWACPCEVMVFDVAHIETLPWPVLAEIALEDCEETEVAWDRDELVLTKKVDGAILPSRRIPIDAAQGPIFCGNPLDR